MPLHQFKANALMKANIDALLRAHHKTRRDLARWCLRTIEKRADVWIAKIMSDDDREVPMKYWDRMADFFGVATYQLLQPGISSITDRRSGFDRRKTRERRISNANAAAQPRMAVDLMDLIRAISPDGQRKAIPLLVDILNDELRGLGRPPATPSAPDAPNRAAETGGSTRAPARAARKKHPD